MVGYTRRWRRVSFALAVTALVFPSVWFFVHRAISHTIYHPVDWLPASSRHLLEAMNAVQGAVLPDGVFSRTRLALSPELFVERTRVWCLFVAVPAAAAWLYFLVRSGPRRAEGAAARVVGEDWRLERAGRVLLTRAEVTGAFLVDDRVILTDGRGRHIAVTSPDPIAFLHAVAPDRSRQPVVVPVAPIVAQWPAAWWVLGLAWLGLWVTLPSTIAVLEPALVELPSTWGAPLESLGRLVLSVLELSAIWLVIRPAKLTLGHEGVLFDAGLWRQYAAFRDGELEILDGRRLRLTRHDGGPGFCVTEWSGSAVLSGLDDDLLSVGPVSEALSRVARQLEEREREGTKAAMYRGAWARHEELLALALHPAVAGACRTMAAQLAATDATSRREIEAVSAVTLDPRLRRGLRRALNDITAGGRPTCRST